MQSQKQRRCARVLGFSSAVCTVVVLVGGAPLVNAAAYTWDGGGADSNYATAANWSSDIVPTSADTGNISSTTTSTYTVTLNTTQAISSLTLGSANAGTSTAVLTSTLNVTNSGNLTVSGALALGTSSAYATGVVTQSGGTVSAGSLLTGANTGARQGFYNLNGGSFTTTGTGNVTLGNAGNGFFTQTGGTASIGGNLNIVTGIVNITNNNNYGSYVISGGSLAISGNLVNGAFANTTSFGNAYATFQVIGSSATSISVAGSYTTPTQSTVSPKRSSTLAESIDNGGVTKINVTGSASLAGTLSLGFKGGMALTSSSSFRLMEAASFSGAFDTLPSSSLWNVAITNDVSGTRDALDASLASSALKGTIDAPTGTRQDVTFAAASSGYVGLTNVGTAAPLQVFIDVNTGTGKTVADLISYFQAAGLTAATTSVGNYDIVLSFTGASSTADYAWDLSSFNSGATLSAVGVSVVPEPAIGATGLGGAMLLLGRYRKPRNG